MERKRERYNNDNDDDDKQRHKAATNRTKYKLAIDVYLVTLF